MVVIILKIKVHLKQENENDEDDDDDDAGYGTNKIDTIEMEYEKNQRKFKKNLSNNNCDNNNVDCCFSCMLFC